MKDEARFASVMASMALVLPMFGRELTPDLQEIYWQALAALSDDEFETAAHALMRTETQFPPPARFLDVIRPTNLTADATRALGRAWDLGKQVLPGQGCWWSGDAIREKVGQAAYEAFHACGGSSAFRDLDSEYHGPGIRKAFVEAYRNQVAADPDRALPLPKPELPQLSTGQVLLAGDQAPAAQRSLLDEFRAVESEHRAAVIATLTKPEPLPVPTPEEKETLDRLGEKIAAKRRQLAALTSRPEPPA